MMSTYKIEWRRVIYGESQVEAESLEEAFEKAKVGKDEKFFDWYDDYDNIGISCITKLDEEGEETQEILEIA